MPLLEVRNLSSGYGRVRVLFDVNLKVDKGELVGIIGPNGSGKTTLLHTIIGYLEAWSGQILFNNKDITKLPMYNRIRMGIGFCPERGGLLRSLSVKENIELSLSYNPEGRERLGEIYKLFPVIKEREKQLAGTLSGGEQRMLCIAKSLILSDSLLILDEPSSGLAPIVKQKIGDSLEYIVKELGYSILLSEQDPTLVARLSTTTYVMEHGSVLKSGPTSEILGVSIEELRKIYLGV
ncbi:MAG: ABC transporter ATP-binding protein [Fervidicoccaceae archaeon]